MLLLRDFFVFFCHRWLGLWRPKVVALAAARCGAGRRVRGSCGRAIPWRRPLRPPRAGASPPRRVRAGRRGATRRAWRSAAPGPARGGSKRRRAAGSTQGPTGNVTTIADACWCSRSSPLPAILVTAAVAAAECRPPPPQHRSSFRAKAPAVRPHSTHPTTPHSTTPHSTTPPPTTPHSTTPHAPYHRFLFQRSATHPL